jgi:hypothetical protein
VTPFASKQCGPLIRLVGPERLDLEGMDQEGLDWEGLDWEGLDQEGQNSIVERHF